MPKSLVASIQEELFKANAKACAFITAYEELCISHGCFLSANRWSCCPSVSNLKSNPEHFYFQYTIAQLLEECSNFHQDTNIDPDPDPDAAPSAKQGG